MTDPGAILAPRERHPEAPFALGEVPRTWGDLLADAAVLARALPAAIGAGAQAQAQAQAPAQAQAQAQAQAHRIDGELMVACGDRYLAAATLLAVWRVGASAALPPNSRQETI